MGCSMRTSGAAPLETRSVPQELAAVIATKSAIGHTIPLAFVILRELCRSYHRQQCRRFNSNAACSEPQRRRSCAKLQAQAIGRPVFLPMVAPACYQYPAVLETSDGGGCSLLYVCARGPDYLPADGRL